jgi:hypothetical protein
LFGGALFTGLPAIDRPGRLEARTAAIIAVLVAIFIFKACLNPRASFYLDIVSPPAYAKMKRLRAIGQNHISPRETKPLVG